MAESEEELKEHPDEGERGEWKSWFKTQHSWRSWSWHPVPSLHDKQTGKQWKQWQTSIFLGSKITVDSDCSHESKKMLTPWKKSYDQPRQHIKKQRHYFANKGLYSQSCGFSSSPVQMWELNYKESWVPENWCLWTVVLEKILESPLDSKEIKLVHPKGNQPWIPIGSTDAEAGAPVVWPPNVNDRFIGKDPDAWKGWRQKEKGDNRGWDGWIVSLTQWTWTWANSGR